MNDEQSDASFSFPSTMKALPPVLATEQRHGSRQPYPSSSGTPGSSAAGVERLPACNTLSSSTSPPPQHRRAPGRSPPWAAGQRAPPPRQDDDGDQAEGEGEGRRWRQRRRSLTRSPTGGSASARARGRDLEVEALQQTRLSTSRCPTRPPSDPDDSTDGEQRSSKHRRGQRQPSPSNGGRSWSSRHDDGAGASGPLPLRVQFAAQDLIGKGSSGKVFRALDRDTNRIIAVKEIPMSHAAAPGSSPTRRSSLLATAETNRAAQAELELLKQLNHPNIVRFLGEERDVEAGCLRIYMELVSGGSVRQLLKTYGRLQERQAASYTQQMLSGLRYLHSKRLVHRDLKGDNLLVETSGALKLADFGTAGAVSTLATPKIEGTAFFMSPEMLTNEGAITEKTDIWSVGCCVLEMMTGRPPLAHLHSQYAIMLMLAQSQGELLHHYIPQQESRGWSTELLDFLRACLRRSPEERPTAAALLEHPWITLNTALPSPPKLGHSGRRDRPSLTLSDDDGARGGRPEEEEAHGDAKHRNRQRHRPPPLQQPVYGGGPAPSSPTAVHPTTSRSCNADDAEPSGSFEKEVSLDVTYPMRAQPVRARRAQQPSRPFADRRRDGEGGQRNGRSWPLQGSLQEGDHHSNHVFAKWTGGGDAGGRSGSTTFALPHLHSPRRSAERHR